MERLFDCPVFWSFEAPGVYLLPDSLDLTYPGVYHITATVLDGPTPCGFTTYWEKMTDVVAEPCVPETLGCGRITLVGGEQECPVWSSLSGQGDYMVDDLGGFSVGDTVLAVGLPCPNCPGVLGTCSDHAGTLREMELLPCPGATPVRQATWGRIKARYGR